MLVNHGGTEMGQGLHTKMLQVAATALRRAPGAGAAGTDPHRQGAEHLGHGRELGGRPQRWRRSSTPASRSRPARPVAADARVLGGRGPLDDGRSRADGAVEGVLAWASVLRVRAAGASCGRPGSTAPRACTGTPRPMQGSPFKYFAYGAAAAEVEVDGFTGAYRTRRVDIVHDVGDCLSPAGRPRARSRAGSCRVPGWLTLEDLRWDESDGPTRGRLLDPGGEHLQAAQLSRDARGLPRGPARGAHEDGAVYGSKAVGEPPLMLAFSVREALRAGRRGVRPAGRQRRPGLRRPLPRRCSGRSSSARHATTDERVGRTSRQEVAEVHWITAVERLRRERRDGLLVTVSDVRGHAPREAGAKMVVALSDLGTGTSSAPAGAASAAAISRRPRWCTPLSCSPDRLGHPSSSRWSSTTRRAPSTAASAVVDRSRCSSSPWRCCRRRGLRGGPRGSRAGPDPHASTSTCTWSTRGRSRWTPTGWRCSTTDRAVLHTHHVPLPELALGAVPRGRMCS